MLEKCHIKVFEDNVGQSTIDDCLKIFEPSPFWSSLPYREAEFEIVHQFINSSFESINPKVCHIHGEKGVGKTSTVQICSLMSIYYTRIEFLDIQQWCDGNYIPKNQHERGLVVIDSPCKGMIIPMLNYFLSINYSLIIITTDSINDENFDQYVTSIIRFGSYDKNALRYILCDKLRPFSNLIKQEAINYIVNRAFACDVGLQGAFDLLIASLINLKHSNTPKLDQKSVENAYFHLIEYPDYQEFDNKHLQYGISLNC